MHAQLVQLADTRRHESFMPDSSPSPATLPGHPSAGGLLPRTDAVLCVWCVCVQREAELRDSLKKANKEQQGMKARSKEADEKLAAQEQALAEAKVSATSRWGLLLTHLGVYCIASRPWPPLQDALSTCDPQTTLSRLPHTCHH